MSYKIVESHGKHTTKVMESPGKSPEMFCTNCEHSTVVEQGLWSVDQSFQSHVNKWQAGHRPTVLQLTASCPQLQQHSECYVQNDWVVLDISDCELKLLPWNLCCPLLRTLTCCWIVLRKCHSSWFDNANNNQDMYSAVILTTRESSLGSLDECRTAPSGRQPSDQATWLGLWVRL